MNVTCTHCSARFEVDEAMLLPDGRKLRCSNCREVFFQKAPSREEQPPVEETIPGQPLIGLDNDFPESLPENGFPGPEGAEGDDEADTVLAPRLMGQSGESSLDERVGESQLPPEEEIAEEDAEQPSPVAKDDAAEEDQDRESLRDGEETGEEEDASDAESGNVNPADDVSHEENAPLEEFQEEEIFLKESREEAVPREEFQEEEVLLEEVQEEEVLLEEFQEEEVAQEASREEEEYREEERIQEEEELREEDDGPEEEHDREPRMEWKEKMPALQDESLEDREEEEEEEKPSRWTLTLPSALLGWMISVVLGLTLAAGIFVPGDWWEFKRYDLGSDFRLTELKGEWRLHSFGRVLVVGGRLANTDRITQEVPRVRITLLDQENNELSSYSVVPGRVVEEKLLDESTEESLRTMIRLQGDTKKVKVERLTPDKELPFQFLFINPPENASRYQVDFETLGQGTG
ncbi:MAG: zinc-ribbon domain-containing protein [Magnetococcales bacterium]|nr:zinc-ribbon domain-containing protein [Magnetococcales bacterium]